MPQTLYLNGRAYAFTWIGVPKTYSSGHLYGYIRWHVGLDHGDCNRATGREREKIPPKKTRSFLEGMLAALTGSLRASSFLLLTSLRLSLRS
jgi:hypothetical protein